MLNCDTIMPCICHIYIYIYISISCMDVFGYVWYEFGMLITAGAGHAGQPQDRENRLVADRMLHLKQKSLVNSEDRSRLLLMAMGWVMGWVMGCHGKNGSTMMYYTCDLARENGLRMLRRQEQVTRAFR